MSSFVRRLCALVIISLAACGDPAGPLESVDALYLQGGGGVTVVDPGAPAPTFNARGGVPSPNWSTVVRTKTAADATQVIASNPADGRRVWSTTVDAAVQAKIVSSDGSQVAMGPMREAHYAYGRRTTRLLIAGDGVVDPGWLTLKGNYEPEAFAMSGKSLFVIKYVPALKPTRYQVRQLDLMTGSVHGVYTPHGELQQTMGGSARVQASSPDGKRLYTLYTVGSGGSQHAFVHVLDLEQEWAHCIDLPDGFGERAESTTTLAVSPDGRTLYAANTTTGILAAIDTSTFEVAATAEAAFAAGRAHAASDDDGTVYVTSGSFVTAFDGTDLTRRWRATVPERARGLQVSSGHLYVGLRSEIASLDVATGEMTDLVDPPGVGNVKRLGPVLEMEQVSEGRSGPITCAC